MTWVWIILCWVALSVGLAGAIGRWLARHAPDAEDEGEE